VSLHSEDFVPLGLNAGGTAIVDSISHLNEFGEPNGFIPFEAEWPMDLTKKTVIELDQELKTYFEEGLRETITEMQTKVFNTYIKEFNSVEWIKALKESMLCISSKDEYTHWWKIIYDIDHRMDWEPTA
jgi:hypothetical protein